MTEHAVSEVPIGKGIGLSTPLPGLVIGTVPGMVLLRGRWPWCLAGSKEGESKTASEPGTTGQDSFPSC